MSEVSLRWGVRPEDAEIVRALTTGTGFFSAEEVVIAVELVDEAVAKGQEASGYFFVFAERGGEVVGYSCFGPIPLTQSAWDLYWIAVDPRAQGAGVGRILQDATEDAVRARGGSRVYAETSTRPQYEPTRGFYRARGYRLAADIPDFYAPGDGKAVFEKLL